MSKIPPVVDANRDHATANLAAFERELAQRGATVTNRFAFPLRANHRKGRWNFALSNHPAQRLIQVAFPGIPLHVVKDEGVLLAIDGETYTWDNALDVAAAALADD